ncbi:asparaginyl-tRNA synthetase [Jimgerdemannia flammicorona]|uniref:asparagine--tRNA ligase n=1 Tax=Jimgerdemannia flammicorona TaxID=994334 RepID=A0A433QVY1_9FUNG|nr:asparaginyl-tRNA synthetase [Jimgerdemannia flammicorona]
MPRLFLRVIPTVSIPLHFSRLYTTASRQILPSQTITHVLKHAPLNSPVTIHGWVRTVRVQKEVCFAHVNDGSNVTGIQVILNEEQAKRLTTGTSVRMEGILVASLGEEQTRELQAREVAVLGKCNGETYPLQKKHHGIEFLRENAHLRTRANSGSAVMRIRSAAVAGFHKFFEEQEFINVHTPILTSHDCEGGGEVFKVTPVSAPSVLSSSAASLPATFEFFGRTVYLTVSGQLHAEILASALSRVYTFGPVFRAESSHTSRHLAEFWMLEAEVAFIDSLSHLLDLTEASIRSVIQHILDTCGPDLALFNKFTDPTLLARLRSTADKPFVRMTYTEAVAVLERAQQAAKTNFAFPPRWGSALQSEHERYLSTNHCAHPVFVTDYPGWLKPFYMRTNTSDGPDNPHATVACTDLLVPGIGELVGGSMREERFEVLADRMREAGLDLEEYAWYLDLRSVRDGVGKRERCRGVS